MNDKHTILRDIFGYDDFRLHQEAIIDTILSGTNTLAIMPTGAGKSLCFQIPALVQEGITIVVSPLVALMQDQVSALKLAGISADAIHSAHDRDTNISIWQRLRRGELKILYMSPERLMDGRMIEQLKKMPITQFAIDEAHCISQWGASFRPEYADLSRLQHEFPTTTITAMTGSADEATRNDIVRRLFSGDCRTFISGYDRPNITLNVGVKIAGTNTTWKNRLVEYVRARPGESGIVYCISRARTEEAESLLVSEGFNAVAYHAGLSKDERTERQNRFMSEDAMIITATIAFGMGIDKSDIRFVFHTDLPSSIESYYQEIGRAGRDGEPADAMMLFSARDILLRRQFIDNENADDAHKRRQHSRLNALLTYAESQTCRRRALLAYFGEQLDECSNCDNCIKPPDLQDGTPQAVLVLRTITATRSLYGQSHIIDILCGAKNQKIMNAHHDQLELHGAGKPYGNKPYWQALVRQMEATGILRTDVAGYSGLKLTEHGTEFLRAHAEGNEPVDSGDDTYTFSFAPPELAPTKPPKPKQERNVKADETIQLSARDNQLFQALKLKRLELAQQLDVPAYVVFHDRTLHEMAHMRPSNPQEFSQLHGVGLSKMEKFGDEFLAVIAEH